MAYAKSKSLVQSEHPLCIDFSSFASAQDEPIPFEEYIVASVGANQAIPVHYFDAQAGDNVRVRLDITQIGFQSFTIRNSSGDVLATGTPPWNNFSTIGTLTIPETGRYFLYIDVDRSTDYEIIVYQREAKLIVMGMPERDFFVSEQTGYLDFAFEGSNTALGTLKIAQPSLPVIETEPLKISLQQNGEVFATYLITDIEGFINQSIQLNFEMENGTVNVIIEYLGDSNHFFTISLELNFGSG